MALADPQSVTVNAVAIPLPRINTLPGEGRFVAADGTTNVVVRPSQNGKTRTAYARMDQKKVMADPLVSTTNVWRGISITLTVKRDNDGYSDADAKKSLTGFLTWAQSAGVVDAFLSGQN